MRSTLSISRHEREWIFNHRGVFSTFLSWLRFCVNDLLAILPLTQCDTFAKKMCLMTRIKECLDGTLPVGAERTRSAPTDTRYAYSYILKDFIA